MFCRIDNGALSYFFENGGAITKMYKLNLLLDRAIQILCHVTVIVDIINGGCFATWAQYHKTFLSDFSPHLSDFLT